MKSRFTPKQDKVIKKLYLDGSTAQQIADRYNVYKQSVLNSLKRSGIKRHTNWDRAKGERNGNWRGGIRFLGGYESIYQPDHQD